MFKKILVATDFSKASSAALLSAISLAERGNGRVEVLHVSTMHEYSYSNSAFVTPDSNIQALLIGKLEDFFPANTHHNSERHLAFGESVSDEILNFARNGRFDLIVVGTHGKGAIKQVLLGSVAQKLSRDSEIPVMIVRDFEHVRTRYQGFDRVLVPTDFSQTSYNALKLGIKFANFLKADLHYIHVIDLPTVTDLSSVYPFLNMTIPPLAGTDVNLTLQKDLEKEYLIGNPKVVTLIGDPVREIRTYSEEQHIDFIIMGTHGRKAIDRALVGSVAAGVIGRSEIPVITVKP